MKFRGGNVANGKAEGLHGAGRQQLGELWSCGGKRLRLLDQRRLERDQNRQALATKNKLPVLYFLVFFRTGHSAPARVGCLRRGVSETGRGLKHY